MLAYPSRRTVSFVALGALAAPGSRLSTRESKFTTPVQKTDVAPKTATSSREAGPTKTGNWPTDVYDERAEQGNLEGRCGLSVINVRAFTDVGLVRKRNEDAILVAGWLSQTREGTLVTMDFAPSTPFVCAVADGMGGHVGGDLASRVALTVISEQSHDWRTAEDIAATLAETNEQVRAIGRDADLQGLGTTVAGLCLTDDGIVIFNVGDSPVFSITDGVLSQISIDDSVFDAQGRPTNIITQSLGQFPPVQPHLTVLPLRPGTYLMCSDGVSGVMTPDDLRAAVLQSDLDDLAANIIETTRQNGAHDNFSFVIVEIPDLQLPDTEVIGDAAEHIAGAH